MVLKRLAYSRIDLYSASSLGRSLFQCCDVMSCNSRTIDGEVCMHIDHLIVWVGVIQLPLYGGLWH